MDVITDRSAIEAQEKVAPVDGAVHDAPAPDDAMHEVAERLDALTSLIVSTQERSRSREAVIEKLHHENSELRSGAMHRVVQPVLLDLIRLHDDLSQQSDVLRTTTDYAARPLASELDSFKQSVLDILFRQSCEPFEVAAGDRFDAARHKPVQVQTTAESDQDSRIADVRRTGFTHLGLVLRPAHTVVWRHTAPAQPSSGGEQ